MTADNPTGNSSAFEGVLEAILRKAKAYDSPEVIKAVEDFIAYCHKEQA